jgi:superfamily I DNA/RNA helicase
MSGRQPSPSARFVHPEDWTPLGLSTLEPEAKSAIQYGGNSAVVAGPGAGKTEFLAQRAGYLFQTGLCSAPQKILAISYKRDSAANLAQRITTRLPQFAGRFVSMTFDAFAKGLVDRFGASLPSPWTVHRHEYEVTFWNGRDVADWRQDAFAAETESFRLEMDSVVNPQRFLHDVVGSWPLPDDPTAATSESMLHADLRWWHDQYLTGTKRRVDFVMLNRLAELLVRSNTQLRAAIRATYPFVFVDEFQDTTAAQITLLSTLFGSTEVITTAVGDGKQRIMRFAGALDEALGRYEKDFGAKRFELSWNFRSTRSLVSAQHVIGSTLDAGLRMAESKVTTEPDHEALSTWTYPSATVQAQHVAAMIATDMRDHGRTAADFVILVRQKVAGFEPALATAFASEGIRVRNDDTQYGAMKLQDLLKHDLTRLLLSVLRLASTPPPLPDAWTTAHTLVSRVTGTDRGGNADRRVADGLGVFIADLHKWLAARDASSTPAHDVVRAARDIINDEQAAAFVAGQNAGDHVSLIIEALIARIEAIRTQCPSWSGLIDRISDEDAVSLMTIHRSKGLEFHTVFVLGLDEREWWSYEKDPNDAMSAFFVAFSRAAQRVVFTTTDAHAPQSGIADLYALLDSAGAVHHRFDPDVDGADSE